MLLHHHLCMGYSSELGWQHHLEICPCPHLGRESVTYYRMLHTADMSSGHSLYANAVLCLSSSSVFI